MFATGSPDEGAVDPQPPTPAEVDWAGLAASGASAESLLALAEVAAGSLSGPELVDAGVAGEKAL